MIFVSISCHDDVDVVPTCRDLIKNALHPDQLRIVVILQTDRLSLFEELSQLPVEVYQFPLSWATGVGKPRHLAATKLQDEDYFLQLDCHMRFQQNWDRSLLNELKACTHDKAILSALPAAFVIETGELLSMTPMAPKLEKFIENIPVSSFEPVDSNLSVPPKIAHIAASLVFCRADAIRTVLPDPHYHYHGEELSQSLRWWTRGYECFAIRVCVAHHAYRTENPKNGADNVNDVMKHWRSLQRIEGLLGTAPTKNLSPLALTELEQYSLGIERTVESWEAEFGVDLKRRIVR